MCSSCKQPVCVALQHCEEAVKRPPSDRRWTASSVGKGAEDVTEEPRILVCIINGLGKKQKWQRSVATRAQRFDQAASSSLDSRPKAATA